jgi:putative transcriptional regulator
MDSARGQLLIAGPQLMDPNFWRTVVLIVEHSREGALGLVLNRPSEATVAETVPELHEILDEDQQVFLGGPVAPSSVIVLARFTDPEVAALIAFADVGVLSGDISLDRPQAGIQLGRAFVGHAGWGPGQLDAEVERGDWILETARHEDAFATDPQTLWPAVLTRKGGSYALLARMPVDPSVN